MEQQNNQFSNQIAPQQVKPKTVKLFWVVILLVSVLALVGVLLWQKNNASREEIINCVKEGGRGFEWFSGLEQNKDKKDDVCCEGLTDIDDVSVFEGGCLPPATGGLAGSFICAYCGNGVCGKGENKCNCPADCK